METENSCNISSKITELCVFYQDERISGRWYITQTGLNKISKLLGGKYSDLTSKQKEKFRLDCISQAQDSIPHVKTWWYYLNIN
jgi:hypothetical protein